MSTQPSRPQDTLSPAEIEIRALYRQLLDSWNNRDASAYASLFIEDGDVIGFDGSQMNGRTEIASTLRQIFADHQTAPYVSKVKNVRFLTPEVVILCAIVGMVPPGRTDINPAVNAIQTLVATRHDGTWHIVQFQNTPAQFHGRPELVERMTEELRQLLK
ncbi:MAG TPA: SgcJ/EcaC family oxidoreductase [Ktedonobacteraceae bacterium]|nr:SgcJ/EcaC family oxidoreductase [Ktedonobacteraceae bacterium]